MLDVHTVLSECHIEEAKMFGSLFAVEYMVSLVVQSINSFNTCYYRLIVKGEIARKSVM